MKFFPNSGHLTNSRALSGETKYTIVSKMDATNTNSGVVVTTCVIYESLPIDHINWEIASHLLGFTERESVAALEARNTALVAALEKIKKEYGLEHGFLRGERPVINLLGEFINEVLEANTEKGGANG